MDKTGVSSRKRAQRGGEVFPVGRDRRELLRRGPEWWGSVSRGTRQARAPTNGPRMMGKRSRGTRQARAPAEGPGTVGKENFCLQLTFSLCNGRSRGTSACEALPGWGGVCGQHRSPLFTTAAAFLSCGVQDRVSALVLSSGTRAMVFVPVELLVEFPGGE